MKALEREKSKLGDEIRERQEREERLRDDFEARINEYEDTLNLKIREKAEKEGENEELRENIKKLEAQIKEIKE